MQPTRGRVPQFTMRPSPILTGSFIFTLIIGFLLAMSFFSKEEGTGQYQQQGITVLIITGFICICLIIVATGKLWFPHLWKKNSTHARHKQHTQHHPTMRDQEYRRRR